MAENPVEFVIKSQKSKFQRSGHILKKYLESALFTQNNLHGYQIEAVLKTRNKIRQEYKDMLASQMGKTPVILKPVLIVAPTGSGKSGILVMITYVLKPQRALIITPSKVTSNQLKNQFYLSDKSKCFFETTGIQTDATMLENLLEIPKVVTSSDDISNYHQLGNLVIVTAQRFGGRAQTSLINRNDEVIKNVEEFFKRFDLLIVDEAHHYPAQTWLKIVKEFSKPGYKNKTIIFLTATPYRNDSSGNPYFILGNGKEDRIAYEITQDRVEGRTIRKCNFLESKRHYTKANLVTDIREILLNNRRIEKRFVPQAMVLVRTRKEAQILVNFINNYIKEDTAIAILGSSGGTSSNNLINDFTKGSYLIGVTCGVGLEGYDNPRVVLCVVCQRIINGRILLSQFAGRCKRMNRSIDGDTPDKSTGIVLSYREFEIKQLWESLNKVAEFDPIDELQDFDYNLMKDLF